MTDPQSHCGQVIVAMAIDISIDINTVDGNRGVLFWIVGPCKDGHGFYTRVVSWAPLQSSSSIHSLWAGQKY